MIAIDAEVHVARQLFLSGLPSLGIQIENELDQIINHTMALLKAKWRSNYSREIDGALILYYFFLINDKKHKS
jgi:hypothetical protein